MRSVLPFAAALLLAGAASAERSISSATMTMRPSIDGAVVVRPFDPSKGTLRKVTICMTAAQDRRYSAENRAAAATVISFTELGSSFRLALPGDDPLSSPVLGADLDVPTVHVPLEGFDGTVDFDGPSGFASATVRTMQTVEVDLVDPALFARFEGTAPVQIPVLAVGRTQAEGPANMTIRAEFLAAVRVAVVYDFQPTP